MTGSRFARPVEYAGAALAVAVAVLVWAVTRTYPNYDSYYHLVWGRQLLDGMEPTFTAYAAPTQHPLYVGLGAVLGLAFGESADRALVLVCLISHALLVIGTYRLGAEVFGRWAGLVAALFVAASASFLLYAARGYVDAPFLALVVWAGVLAATGRSPWVLLVLAGLLRPEAWVLTGLAWLATLWPPRPADPAAPPAPAPTSPVPVGAPPAPAASPSGPAASPSGPAASPSGPGASPSGPAASPSAPGASPSGPAASPSGPATSPPAPAASPRAPAGSPPVPVASPPARAGWRRFAPRSRPPLAATVALVFAPAFWALTDWIVTGDPLHSLHATSELADDLGRVRGLQHVPGSFVSFVGATVRPPVALLAPIGAVLAWRLLGWWRMRVPLALFAAGVITFVGTGALGLSILPRYLTVPAVALCLFAGYALVGFTALAPDHPWRRRWAQGSAAATVLGAIGLIILAPSITNVREEVRFIRATHDSLIATLDDPAVREHLRCGTLTFPTYRLVPDAKWHLPDASIGARSAQRRPTGVEVFALGQKALKRYGFAAGTSPSVNLPSPGFVPIARHGILAAFGRC